MRLTPLLLDLDGTLMDSEAVHRRHELALMAYRGVTFTEERLMAYQGFSLEGMLDDFRVQGLADWDVGEFTATLDATLAPALAEEAILHEDARIALERWQGQGRPLALVTSSRRRLVEAVQARHPVLAALPVVVTVDDVTRPKPDPEPYEQAAKLLGVDPRECWAVEDSTSGWRSAHRAGSRVALIARPGHPPATGADPEAWLTSLREWDPVG